MTEPSKQGWGGQHRVCLRSTVDLASVRRSISEMIAIGENAK